MAKDERQRRLTEIANELFEMANSYATEKEDIGNAATFLHESVNNIWKAQKCLNGADIPIPIDFLFRSMGIDTEQMIKDVADISDIGGQNNED